MGGNNDGFIQIDEWLAYQASLPDPLAVYFVQSWIFNIADLVWTDQGLVNDGSKLLQLRFYPVETTQYTAPRYIILDKVTSPSGDTTEFTFQTSYYNSTFKLTDGGLPDLSGPLAAGTYYVTETQEEGWEAPVITFSDINSTASGNTATVVLEAGETVEVTFTNAKQGVNLSINKTDGLAQATVGNYITYTISVGNFGTVDATSVTVTDTLPSEEIFDSSSVTPTLVSPGVYQWTLGTIPATGTYSSTIIVTVLANSAVDPAINTATVDCIEVDIDPATNTAIDETVILATTF
jgi:uncharacterized repeat protein (TIGR01451 family)